MAQYKQCKHAMLKSLQYTTKVGYNCGMTGNMTTHFMVCLVDYILTTASSRYTLITQTSRPARVTDTFIWLIAETSNWSCECGSQSLPVHPETHWTLNLRPSVTHPLSPVKDWVLENWLLTARVLSAKIRSSRSSIRVSSSKTSMYSWKEAC